MFKKYLKPFITTSFITIGAFTMIKDEKLMDYFSEFIEKYSEKYIEKSLEAKSIDQEKIYLNNLVKYFYAMLR